ncbi:DUF6376 family protein [Paenibacillus sp. OV219]|uniref:DUF6376 family protein n=1 Tax=Paenibacillus sp. OV219 TaxID=1884377 RepID=UPI0008C58FE5|nr:DUF6376 family protein [Paenibacillus sp. OV219]SEN99808.1 hypothetical protein SAMN05518847_105206 [Paenibacillus sp. OV219]
MLRKLAIVVSVLVVILGGAFLYYKDTIIETVHFAKQTKETASKVNEVNKKLPALIEQAKGSQGATKSEDKSAAEQEIKQQLITVKQELNKLVQTEPPAKLKSLQEKLAASSDEANQQIDEYISQIDNGHFDPEQFEALYEQMKDSPEFKEAEKYLNMLK